MLKSTAQSCLHAYSIAVASTPLPALTYLAEEGLQAGERVLVPIRQGQQVGLVLGRVETVDTGFTLKPIIARLDSAPLWQPNELALLHWCSRYYHAHWGRLLDTVLPTVLRKPRQSSKPLKVLPVSPIAAPNLLPLTPEQAEVTERLKQQQGFVVSLLEGVTGSGKTEVYAHLIADQLACGKQVLLLVPEIGLTPQILQRLATRLSITPLALHSGMSDGMRARTWLATATGVPLLLIGTRSAVFAPLPNLGLIIIDEEHDTAYKQQDSIRYHARDVAVMRGRFQSCPVLLGSATPSLESLNNVQQAKYAHFHLTQRANQRPLPVLEGIDLRQQVLTAGLSPQLIRRVEQSLADGDQVLLFLNRRGYAPVLMCHDCGHTLDCPACDLPYTFHRSAPNLRCHHCGKVSFPPKVCPSCGAQHWHLLGQGTQQVEEVLHGLFPNTVIARIDRDSTQGKDRLANLLADIASGEVRLILGTQMLAKGHDFAGIGLVGILDVDGALFARDFRALERLAQLVTQVSGRTGRGQKAGRVLLQTHQPHHPFVQSLLTQGYAHIAKGLLAERAQAQLPPFGFSAWVMAEGKQLTRVQTQLQQLAQTLQGFSISVAGPIPALMHRRQNYYRELLWLQAEQRSQLHHAITHLLDRLNQPAMQVSGVRLMFDIDPQDMP